MHILIHGTPEQVIILTKKINSTDHQVTVFKGDEKSIPEADLYIDALFEDKGPIFKDILHKPVLANAVITISAEMADNTIRFNGWDGFIGQDKMEIAGKENIIQEVASLLSDAGIETVISADTCGMIGPRVVAMIINEAYFALSENISTKAEIDIAMKSGTNYPYGPFEWCEMIGIEKIKNLLHHLKMENSRYEIAPALIKN